MENPGYRLDTEKAGMMRVLIVDDQPVSRKKIQKIMEGVCNNDAVDCGLAAIEAYQKSLDEQSPFDLITLDVSMPDMNGTEVLKSIRKLESERDIPKDRQVKILMITAASDKDTVIACIKSGCDDYIIKPLNKESISIKFKKFGFNVEKESKSEKTTRQMIETTIQRVNRGQIDLPAMPQVVREIQDVMGNPGSGADEIAHVIEKDILISLKVIAAANSPLYRGVEKIETVKKAISRIGIKEISGIVTMIANKSLYETKNKQLKELLEKLWLHSLACAHAARLISEKTVSSFASKAFMGGLVHDIGVVLLLKSLGEIISQNMKLDENDLINSLSEVHADFGAALLNKWDFTQDLVKAAKLHEWTNYSPETEKEILIINLADHMVEDIGFGFFHKEKIALSDLDSAKLLGIDAGTLEEISKAVPLLMDGSSNDS